MGINGKYTCNMEAGHHVPKPFTSPHYFNPTRLYVPPHDFKDQDGGTYCLSADIAPNLYNKYFIIFLGGIICAFFGE